MSMGYMPGMAGKSFGSGSFGSGSPISSTLTNSANNNIGQVYQDMGQNYQRFGQAYQQATQAANQLRSASTTQQQQMNQYLQALQTALGGMSTAGQNTTNQQPMGQPGFSNGLPGRLFDLTATIQPAVITPEQQKMIDAQTQAFTGTIAPAYQQAVAGATGLYGAPSMNPQATDNYIMSPETPEFYNRYASVIFGDQASAYTPNFQG